MNYAGYHRYQPQDNIEMPAAGMPSGRKNEQQNQREQFAMTQKQQYFGNRNTAQPFGTQSPPQTTKSQFYSPVHHKVVNPPPQRPYKPRENNIFDSPQAEEQDVTRFQTTYTQFANRQKFQGNKEGEYGGLRIHNATPDPAYMYE